VIDQEMEFGSEFFFSETHGVPV